MTSLTTRPFFSVVVATFNASATLDKCLESLIKQSERPEVIVVDGASKDKTLDIAKRYVRDYGVLLVSEPDNGVFDAWNKGVNLASGSWIVFLGADDFYANPASLEILRRRIEEGGAGLEVAYGAVEIVAADGRIIGNENSDWTACKDQLNINMPFTHTGTAHRRDLFDHRSFNPSYKIAGDYHFLFPSLRKSDPLFVSEYIVQMGDGGLSNSSKNRIRLINEIRQIQMENNVRNSFRQRAWLNGKLCYYKMRRFFE